MAPPLCELCGCQITETDQECVGVQGYADLGNEILSDAPDVTHFVMGVATGGCAMGAARALRADRDVKVEVVEPAESPYLSAGEGGDHNVEGLAVVEDPPLLDNDRDDAVRSVREADGREMARTLANQEGLFVGSSSGLNLAAAVEIAAEREPGDVVTTVACDTGLKYLDADLFEGQP